MSAAEDDSELRDLLIHNLENTGVLNKLKAQMRAAVFLAMEDQDRLQNKTPLINESLDKCLDTRDGRLVTGLIVDFLQEYHLDLSLSVFRPEINRLKGVDGRVQVQRELGLPEQPGALLLQLIQSQRGSDLQNQHLVLSRPAVETQKLSHEQRVLARSKFDLYDPDNSGFVQKDDLKCVFMDLFPSLNKNMVSRFVSDELSSLDTSTPAADFLLLETLYQRLVAQCTSVVLAHAGHKVTDAAGHEVTDASGHKVADAAGHEVTDASGREVADAAGREVADAAGQEVRGQCQQENKLLDEQSPEEEEVEEEDSFFDDPLPPPQKTYGRQTQGRQSPAGSQCEDRKWTPSVSDPHRPAGSEPEEPRLNVGRIADEDYDDDFNSHRSELTRSDLSIGEEIEEVSIEGLQDSEQCEDTQDTSVSRLSPGPADFMEDVS